jgi:hypothetical protein
MKQIFHPMPWMQHATPVLDEREEVTAASGVIVSPLNCNAGIVTEQKGADRALADEKHIARSVSGQDVFDLANDARLGIDCSFPSPNADEGLREKTGRPAPQMRQAPRNLSLIDHFRASPPALRRRRLVFLQ